MSTTTIHVLIADDHPTTADGVQVYLERHGSIRVVGSVASFADIPAALARSLVHVLILDLSGMQGSPLLVVERLRRTHPTLAIVIFSAMVDMAPELLRAGALGYVVKSDPTHALLQAVEVAARGAQFLSPTVSFYLESITTDSQIARLTGQELLVVKLLAGGHTTEEIAAHLSVRAHSVQNYVYRALTKMGYSRRSQLIDWYRRMYLADATLETK